jgi:hypothetical protein
MKLASSFLALAVAILTIPAILAAQIIETTGSTAVMGGEYNVMNNVWGATTAQRLEVDLDGTYFKVVLSEHNNSGGSVASYPAIFKGCHWGWCTTKDNPMPIKVSDIDSAPFTWRVDTKDVSGTWNTAFEAWFDDAKSGTTYTGELMIWIDYAGGAGPGGSKVGSVNIGGHSWDVYFAAWTQNYIAYKITTVTDSVSVDLKDFIHDALTRGYLSTKLYMVAMEAGFEIWRGGQGLTTLSYSADVVPGGYEDNYAPVPFALRLPLNNRSVKTMINTFKWLEALDGNSDPIEYIFHLFGTGLDTVVTQIYEDSLVFDGINCLLPNTTYTWFVEATDGIDTTASMTQRKFITPVATVIDVANKAPGQFFLSQNFPNPFNSQTEIQFELQKSAPIELSIFDVKGKMVRTMISGSYRSGQHKVLFDASDLPSGIYFYQLKTPYQVQRRKCLYIK